MHINRMFITRFSRIFIPSMILLSLVTGLLYYRETRSIHSVLQTKEENRIQLLLGAINGQLHTLKASALFLAEQQNLQHWVNDRNVTRKVESSLDIRSYMIHHPEYDQVRYFDAKGHEIIRVERQQPNNVVIVADDELHNSPNRYYAPATKTFHQGQVYLSPFYLNIEQGKIETPHTPMLKISTSVYTQSGNLAGEIILTYLGNYLLQELRNLATKDTRQVWLLNSDSYWLLGPTREDEWGFIFADRKTKSFSHRYPDIWTDITSSSSGIHALSGADGLFTFSTLHTDSVMPEANNHTWHIVSFTPTSYLDSQTQTINQRLAIFYSLLTGLILLSSTLIARKDMARDASDKLLRKHEEQYRNLLEGAPDAIVIVDDNGLIHLINSAAEKIFGYIRSELIGQCVDILLPEPLQQRHKQHRQSYTNEPSVRPMGASNDLLARHKDGRLLPVEISLSPFVQDQQTLVTAIIRDITTRREHDQKIRELNAHLIARSAELEAINNELEAFSYSVSHDLRAPLRAIDGFSQTLLKDYSEHLDIRGQDRLERIRAAAQRMGLLIDSLLTLARISRTDINKEFVDLSSMISNINAELQQTEPARNISITIQADLIAYADKHLLSVVMTNLLANAWKFTTEAENPCITVYRISKDNEKIYAVNDNGAGFNMAYAEKLFGAFQRLHSTNQFPGTGIGLATVQRIIHKHGGRIWAEAEEGKGATFYFTLDEKEFRYE